MLNNRDSVHLTVQMDGTGTSKWTQIQINGESPLIWTVRLDERPNKRPYTVNLDVQITPFGLGSLYERVRGIEWGFTLLVLHNEQ